MGNRGTRTDSTQKHASTVPERLGQVLGPKEKEKVRRDPQGYWLSPPMGNKPFWLLLSPSYKLYIAAGTTFCRWLNHPEYNVIHRPRPAPIGARASCETLNQGASYETGPEGAY